MVENKFDGFSFIDIVKDLAKKINNNDKVVTFFILFFF